MRLHTVPLVLAALNLFAKFAQALYPNGNLPYIQSDERILADIYKDSKNWYWPPEKSCTTNVCDNQAQEIASFLNTSVDPCDNFYEFSCQGWEAKNTIPDWAEEWSVFTKAQTETNKIVQEILEEPISSDDLLALTAAKQYYKKCINAITNDTETNERTIKYVLDTLESYGGWPILYGNGTWNSSGFNWMRSVVGLKRKVDWPTIFDIQVWQDLERNVTENKIVIRKPSSQQGSLEDSEKDNEQRFSLDSSFHNFIVNVSKVFLNYSGKTAINETYLKIKALQIFYVHLEYIKIKNSLSVSQLLGIKFRSEFTAVELEQFLNDNSLSFFTNVNLVRLLNLFYEDTGIVIEPTQKVAAPELEYLLKAFNLMSRLTDEALANYLHFRMVLVMLDQSDSIVFKNYVKEFGLDVTGSVMEPPRNIACTTKTEKIFPFVVGHEYIQKINRTNDDFSKVISIFEDVKRAYKVLIQNSDFAFINQTFLGLELYLTDICPGYPYWINDKYAVEQKYAGLQFIAGFENSSSFLQLNLDLNSRVVKNELKKLRKAPPLDGCNWVRFPGSTGAYNKIFTVYTPLGILQLPFYNDDLPRSLKYGRLGSIIGHEIAHGLAGKGWSEYSNGLQTPVAKCLIDYYSNITVDELGSENKTVNGEFTLEENLADNAGLLAAYKAYKEESDDDSNRKLKGLQNYSSDQIFYIGFAQTYCVSASLSRTRYRLISDEHTLGQFRVLGTLRNSKEFAEAWNCAVGTNMNPQPDFRDKCEMF